MSRVGKQQLNIPAGVEFMRNGQTITIKGPQGSLSRNFLPLIDIKLENGIVTFEKTEDTKFSRALWGTYASHINNMIMGVQNPFVKKLILEGVGFKSAVNGKNLELALGFSHPVVVAIPEELTVTAEKNVITFSGINKEIVGQFSSKIRAMKKPEPYKGKGFHYDGEVIRRKQGKKSA